MANIFNLADFDDLFQEGDQRRKDLIFLARTAEAAERYTDMCSCMKKLVEENHDKEGGLTVDERNLLSVAYKNVIGARRASWRTLNAEMGDEKNIDLTSKYKDQVEAELKEICDGIISILEKQLIKQSQIDEIMSNVSESPQSSPEGEAQVFYLKMTGDYYRYLAEAFPVKDEDDQEQVFPASEYYRRAFELSEKVLEPTHPIRLGLALNYSVCFYEILKDKKKACELAKSAFDEAISKLDKLEEADYKDSTLIMQLLRDNLTLWTSADGGVEDNQYEDGLSQVEDGDGGD